MKKQLATGILASFLLIGAVPQSYGQSQTSKEVSSQQVEKLDINLASVEELTALKGIGQAKAEAIVEYRERIGGFTHIEDLKEVKGIGSKLLKKIQSKLRV